MVEAISNVQSMILQAAAGSDNRVLSLPEQLEHEAAEQIVAKFLELGWVRQIKAVNDRPVWRNDPTTGAAFSLKLTRIGMIAAAALRDEGGGDAATTIAAAMGPEVEAPDSVEKTSENLTANPNNTVGSTDSLRAPRGGSKLDQVLTMLKADGGATIEEIMVATDWLPHSTRAILTGLRKRGYLLSHTKGERGGASVYRVSCSGGGLSA